MFQELSIFSIIQRTFAISFRLPEGIPKTFFLLQEITRNNNRAKLKGDFI